MVETPILLFLPDSLRLFTLSRVMGKKKTKHFCVGQLKLMNTLQSSNNSKHGDIFREVDLFLFLEIYSVLSKQASPVVSVV